MSRCNGGRIEPESMVEGEVDGASEEAERVRLSELRLIVERLASWTFACSLTESDDDLRVNDTLLRALNIPPILLPLALREVLFESESGIGAERAVNDARERWSGSRASESNLARLAVTRLREREGETAGGGGRRSLPDVESKMNPPKV